MLKGTPALALITLTALGLSACGGARKPTSDPAATVCQTDQDCADPATQFCDTDGQCRTRQVADPGSCVVHTDCPTGFCHPSGTCVECLNDDHCGNEVCNTATGTCMPTTGCESSDDCGALECNPATHRCVQCLGDEHCGPDEICRDNACFADGGGTPSCTTQADCTAYALVCDTAAGECVPCEVDALTGVSDCPDGLQCSGGRCSPSTPPGGDGTCTTGDDCGGQACLMGYCMPCFDDMMCADLLTGASKICDVATGNCIDPQCATAEDCPAGQGCYGGGHCGECVENTECRAGEACLDGACGGCTDAAQCVPGESCVDNVCTPPPAGSVGFGELCTGSEDCAAGLVCLPGAAGAICTRTCIGSGQGGDADCPAGYACQRFAEPPFDGVMLCNAAEQLGADTPGYPFSQAPGDSCAESNACQTGICEASTQTCARTCRADRDCAAEGEVCRGEVDTGDADALTGVHACAATDATATAVGDACEAHGDCDTGLCMGTCSNGAPCDGWWDCLGECTRTCRAHCRSNADCGAAESCNPWPTTVGLATSGYVPACFPKYGAGTKADGESCTSYEECASDWCVEGICTTMCAIDADCAGALAGKACTVVVESDDSGNPVGATAFCL